MKVEFSSLAKAFGSEPASVIVLKGTESWLRNEALQIIQTSGGRSDPRPLEKTSSKSVGESELAALFDDLRTPSLFGGDDRVVVLDPAGPYLEADPDAFVDFLDEGWGEATLVLVCDSLDGRKKLPSKLSKVGWVVDCQKPFHRPPPWKTNSPPWENPLNEWIRERVRKAGASIDPPVAHLLMSRVGTTLADLAQAVERIAPHAEEGVVDRDLVEKHTPDGEESSLFELVDACFSGPKARAVELVGELLRRGSVDQQGNRVTDPNAFLLQFVAVAIQRLRQLREVHRIRSSGGNDDEVMKRAGIAKFALPRVLEQARTMPPGRIDAAFRHLHRADLDLKRGLGPRADELLERVVARS